MEERNQKSKQNRNSVKFQSCARMIHNHQNNKLKLQSRVLKKRRKKKLKWRKRRRKKKKRRKKRKKKTLKLKKHKLQSVFHNLKASH